jgi:hypothetical protein
MTNPNPAIPTTFKLTKAVRDDLDFIADCLPRDQRNRSAAMRYAVSLAKSKLQADAKAETGTPGKKKRS